MGMMKCSPARTVGQVSRRWPPSDAPSMLVGRSGQLAACFTANRYSASTVAPTAQGAAAPSSAFMAPMA